VTPEVERGADYLGDRLNRLHRKLLDEYDPQDLDNPKNRRLHTAIMLWGLLCECAERYVSFATGLVSDDEAKEEESDVPAA